MMAGVIAGFSGKYKITVKMEGSKFAHSSTGAPLGSISPPNANIDALSNVLNALGMFYAVTAFTDEASGQRAIRLELTGVYASKAAIPFTSLLVDTRETSGNTASGSLTKAAASFSTGSGRTSLLWMGIYDLLIADSTNYIGIT